MFALLHKQNLQLCSTPALSMSNENAAHTTQCNANNNGTKNTKQNLQNLHNALVHSKTYENVNLQVACCAKHDQASVASAAACGTTYIAQHMYLYNALQSSDDKHQSNAKPTQT